MTQFSHLYIKVLVRADVLHINRFFCFASFSVDYERKAKDNSISTDEPGWVLGKPQVYSVHVLVLQNFVQYNQSYIILLLYNKNSLLVRYYANFFARFICFFMSMRIGTCVGHSANSIVFETQLVLETQLESSDIAWHVKSQTKNRFSEVRYVNEVR